MGNDAVVSRREILQAGAAWLGAPRLSAAASHARVAIARCRSYQEDLLGILSRLSDQIGGIGSLVRGKTVALKINLTGNITRFPERPDMPYRTHPATVLATVQLLARNGARRVRILESFFPARQDLALWARYGLDVKAISNSGVEVEWENTQNLGYGKKYSRLKVPWGGYVFPAYDLNHSYEDCDVFVSLSKLKNHWIAGVTMAMKNNFGITPCSLYGGDCGPDGNEDPKEERGPVCHIGSRTPPRGVPQELKPDSPRDAGYRVPRIVVDLTGARPIDLCIVDGIESIRGGEGIWNPGVQMVRPGVLLMGRNPVAVDTVCTAVMGYDPRAQRGTKPFLRGDNCLLLAEAVGLGPADLSAIEIVGLSLKEAVYDYGPGPIGKPI
jgi:uncharacterized protein (DUF362 family)